MALLTFCGEKLFYNIRKAKLAEAPKQHMIELLETATGLMAMPGSRNSLHSDIQRMF